MADSTQTGRSQAGMKAWWRSVPSAVTAIALLGTLSVDTAAQAPKKRMTPTPAPLTRPAPVTRPTPIPPSPAPVAGTTPVTSPAPVPAVAPATYSVPVTAPVAEPLPPSPTSSVAVTRPVSPLPPPPPRTVPGQNGFATAVERLLADARRQAAAGHVDESIKTALRARKIAEASAMVIGDDPHVSTAAADDLLQSLYALQQAQAPEPAVAGPASPPPVAQKPVEPHASTAATPAAAPAVAAAPVATLPKPATPSPTDRLLASGRSNPAPASQREEAALTKSHAIPVRNLPPLDLTDAEPDPLDDPFPVIPIVLGPPTSKVPPLTAPLSPLAAARSAPPPIPVRPMAQPDLATTETVTVAPVPPPPPVVSQATPATPPLAKLLDEPIVAKTTPKKSVETKPLPDFDVDLDALPPTAPKAPTPAVAPVDKPLAVAKSAAPTPAAPAAATARPLPDDFDLDVVAPLPPTSSKTASATKAEPLVVRESSPPVKPPVTQPKEESKAVVHSPAPKPVAVKPLAEVDLGWDDPLPVATALSPKTSTPPKPEKPITEIVARPMPADDLLLDDVRPKSPSIETSKPIANPDLAVQAAPVPIRPLPSPRLESRDREPAAEVETLPPMPVVLGEPAPMATPSNAPSEPPAAALPILASSRPSTTRPSDKSIIELQKLAAPPNVTSVAKPLAVAKSVPPTLVSEPTRSEVALGFDEDVPNTPSVAVSTPVTLGEAKSVPAPQLAMATKPALANPITAKPAAAKPAAIPLKEKLPAADDSKVTVWANRIGSSGVLEPAPEMLTSPKIETNPAPAAIPPAPTPTVSPVPVGSEPLLNEAMDWNSADPKQAQVNRKPKVILDTAWESADGSRPPSNDERAVPFSLGKTSAPHVSANGAVNAVSIRPAVESEGVSPAAFSTTAPLPNGKILDKPLAPPPPAEEISPSTVPASDPETGEYDPSPAVWARDTTPVAPANSPRSQWSASVVDQLSTRWGLSPQTVVAGLAAAGLALLGLGLTLLRFATRSAR